MPKRGSMTTQLGESTRPDLTIDLATAGAPITVDDVSVRVTAIEGAITAGGDCLDPAAVANARSMVDISRIAVTATAIVPTAVRRPALRANWSMYERVVCATTAGSMFVAKNRWIV